ncbi:Calcium-activated outward-rectifying potassium channel, putative [Ectocarpus siliculosus]|uniref:Calcium-activated outward-rectifying potassium channel, putative n=1 Tax=Ectocarpus siliculosus TaxID=2880 RepID=D7FN95_ECTSI|nr:Calcium-activated outward-rectifying potassium channel, putative [Ectocarpus siliculosus]|eukprot:CBJ30152.1 Calcium-activated outward-rectifying potassium channel, putative [Ectocarpus siliculosus]
MASSPPGSSERSSLLANTTSTSLNQPFMAGYDNGGSPSSPILPADAALPPSIPRTASELEAAEEARLEAVAAQAEIPEAPRAPLTGKGLLALSLATVFGYLCLGVLMYTTLAGMSFLDALYFCVVTLTTVGYGDLSAHKPVTKLFACFYILIGVAMVAAFLSKLVELLLDEQEDLLVNLLTKNRAQAMGAEDPDTAAKVEVGLGVFYFLLLVGVGTTVFMVCGHMSVIDAFYLTVVSSSTVGYGDYFPSSTGTRLFAIFFLPLSTLLLGKIISDYTEMQASKRVKQRQTRLLLATVTAHEYAAMDADNDNRVSLMEFMVHTLIKQEKVTQEDIEQIHTRFTALDKDHNGFVTRDEVGEERDEDGDGFIDADEL